MMSRQSRRHWQMVGSVSVVIAGLGACNLLLSQTEIDMSPLEGDVRSGSERSMKPNSAPIPSLDLSFDETLVRPIFSPNRRNYVAEQTPDVEATPTAAEPEPPTETAPPQVTLQGTRTIAGSRSALLTVSGQDSRWMAVGDLVEGWTVVEITTDHLLISRGDKQVDITLYPDAGRN